MTTTFADLRLDDAIFKATNQMGFEQPSPIQAMAIPVLMEGHDIIGQAQTGTGKTAAFGIPMLQRINPKNRALQALVLCPTRELAVQVAEEIQTLGMFVKGLNVLAVYGGQSIDRQLKALARGVQVVVGTPGRIMDHMERGTIRMNEVQFLVLDEADEMLNMGFREDIEKILKDVPEDAQRAFFSATMPPAIKKMTESFLRDPQHLRIEQKSLTVAAIEQTYYEIRPHRKMDALCRLLDSEDFRKVLIFCSTKRMVDEMTTHLQTRGYQTDALHGDLAQTQRDRVMGRFRTGELKVLAATDVAARGLDVDDVEAVINYDIPYDVENYVHRIGRTGRAGRTGKAFTIITARDIFKIRDIMRYTKATINKGQLPTLKDVLKIKTARLLEEVQTTISADQDMQRYVDAIESMIEYDSPILAAGLLKLLMQRDFGMQQENEVDDLHEREPAQRRGTEKQHYDRSKYDFENRRGRGFQPGGRFGGRSEGEPGERGERGSYPAMGTGGKGRPKREYADENMVRLFVNVGKNQNIRPGDLVGAIAGEAQISGKQIGGIELHDRFSFVDVDSQTVDKVITAMNGASIRGLTLSMERAEPMQKGRKR